MRAVVIILLSLISLLSFSQDDLYKWGRPTSKGVDAYVERNWLVFIEDYQEFVNDTLFFEPFISTDDLSDYVNYTRGDMGYYERPDNIIISNEPRYIDYELSRLSDYEKNRYREATQFVRGVVMHELTHCYIYQIMMMAQYDKKLEYEWRQGLRIIPVDSYGTDFLEEGVCEYVVELMDEMICGTERIVISRNDLSIANRNQQRVKYAYSRQFVKPVVEEYGLKAAIYLMITNKPPSDEEILDPDLYYDRLNWK